MRTLLPFAGTAALSFILGYTLMRWHAPEALPRQQSYVSDSVVKTSKPDDSTDASTSSARIQTILELGQDIQGIEKEHAFFTALQKLDAGDLLAGADQFADLLKRTRKTSQDKASAMCEAWLECWLELDSPTALRWIENSTLLDDLYQAQNGTSLLNILSGPQSAAFKVLARRHPDWTRQYLAAREVGPRRDIGIYQLHNELARKDPGKAKGLLESFAGDANRAAAIQGYVAGMSVVDARAGFETALSEPTGPLRDELMQIVLRETSRRGVASVRELLDRIADPVLRRRMVAEAALNISWHSREDPLPWLMEEAQRPAPPGGTEGYDYWTNYVGQALTTTVNGDCAPAVNWAASLENDPDRKLLHRILGNWASSNPAAARDWLSAHPSALEGKGLDSFSSSLARMARNDAAATRAWADALPPGALRDRAQFQIALSSGTEGNLDQAIAAYRSVSTSDPKGELAKQLAVVLTKQDGAIAAQWATGMKEGDVRSAAIAAVAEQWTQIDPRGSAQWIVTLPPGAVRDRAVREFAAKVVYAEPVTAAEWVAQVADPGVRTEAARLVFTIWNWEDPVASRVWLRSLPGVEEKWRTDALHNTK
jgi:hypothetical protein